MDLDFQFYLMYKLICQKPAHFWTAQMAVLSSFFQGFIVLLGMYNFGVYQKGKLAMLEKSWQEASALAFI